MEDVLAMAQDLNYSEPASVMKAVREVKDYFVVFEPKIERRGSKTLICLSGNLPVPRIAKTVPLQIWLPLEFPRKSPVFMISLNATDLVNPIGHADIVGTIKHIYLERWEKNSRLTDLLQMLTTEFADVFPVFDFRHFNLPTKAKHHVVAIMKQHPHLMLSWAKYTNDGGSQTIELKLEGLLGKKGKYDYSIRIWLFVGFPYTPPDVYVLPGDGCVLAKTIHLYNSGKVRHSYLKDWEYPNSNVITFLNDLCSLFADNSPVRPLAQLDDSSNRKKAKSFLDKVKLKKATKDKESKRQLKPVREIPPTAPTPAPRAPVLATRLPRKPIRGDSKEVREFAQSAGLSEDTIRIVLNNGFTTLRAILCMQEDDLARLGLPMAEHCLFRETLRQKRQAQQESYYNRSATTASDGEDQDKATPDKSDDQQTTGSVKSAEGEDLFARAMKRLLKPLMVTDGQLTVKEEIGRGEFGVVFKGVLQLKENSPPEDVAIKTVVHKVGSGHDDIFIEDFCQEILQLRMLNHPNIVCLKALAMLDGKPHMVLPYMANGDLRKYISNPDIDLTVEDILRIGLQVARGMKYLSDQNFIHGDLAARNCLVDGDGTVKVGDFGLARQLHLSEYFKMDPEKSRPLRWMAPESLMENKCTLKSDVWSFGILMWELMTRGQRPYPEVSNTMLLPGMIANGYRMSCPAYTPQEIYEMMLFCWEEDQNKRPEFDVIVQWFETILSGEDESQLADEAAGTRASYGSSSLSSSSSSLSLSTDTGSIHTGRKPPQKTLPPLPPKEPLAGRQMAPEEDNDAVKDDLSELSLSEAASGGAKSERSRPVTLMPPSSTPKTSSNDRKSI